MAKMTLEVKAKKTDAQAKIKELKDQVKDLKSEVKNLKGELKDMHQPIFAANDGMKGLLQTVRDIRTIIAVIEGARMFASMITEGLKFNALLETSKFGLASLIATFTDMTDATGRHLSMLEQYNYAQHMAVDLQTKMKVAALQTTLQYSDLLDVMQRGLPFMLKYFHDKEGKVVSNQKLVDFTAAFSQGAAAFGLGPEEIGTNIQRLMQGTADARHARFAYTLLQDIGGNSTQIKEQLKLWEQQGVLYDKLTEKVSAFKRAGQDMMGTFAGTWSNFKDAIQQALGEGTTGAAHDLQQLLRDITLEIVQVDAHGKATFNPEFITTIQNVATAFVGVSKALGSVAGFLVTIGAQLQQPSMKNLFLALGGAVGGGLVTGSPLGAGAGAIAMYLSGSIADREQANMAASPARRQQLQNAGKGFADQNLIGVFPEHFGGGTQGFDQIIGQDLERMSQIQRDIFIGKLKQAIKTQVLTEKGIGTFNRKTLSYEDYRKARESAFSGVQDDITVRSKPGIPDEEQIRRAAVALEKYESILDRLLAQLAKDQLKLTFKAAADSYDMLIAKSKDSKFQVLVNGKLEERNDPFPTIDLERQKAELKALNDWAEATNRVATANAQLEKAKKEAGLSKYKPEDAAKEAEVHREMIETLKDADNTYNEAKKKARIVAEAATDKAVSAIYDKFNKDVFEQAIKSWKEYYENRLKMEEEAIQRSVNLYKGLADGIKSGMRGVVESLMGGGKGNPFTAVLDSFKHSWTEYLGSFGDKWLSQLAIIASGKREAYRYTSPGETGPNDPGGLPVYAGASLSRQARVGMAIGQGAAALYGLYQQGQTGTMSKGQGAISGAAQGASVGAAFGPYGMIFGAMIGGLAGFALGGQKAGYSITVSDGKLSIKGTGKTTDADVAAAERSINAAITAARNTAMNILTEFPASIMQALMTEIPDSILKDGTYGPAAAPWKSQTFFGKLFDAIGFRSIRQKAHQEAGGLTGDQLKEFIATEIPKMILDAYTPIFQEGLTQLGVTKDKLKEIFSRTGDAGFDATQFLQQLNDYVKVIVGLQDAMKFLQTKMDNGSGWDMKAEAANDIVNPKPYSQISAIDTKISALTAGFGNLSWEEQIQAAQTILGLVKERNQLEIQALVEMRNAWLNIEASVNKGKDSIRYSELADPTDPAGTAKRESGYWRGKAANAMQNLLGLMNNPDATVADVNKYAQEAQEAAANLYQVMKGRYEDEMALVRQIDDAIKNVTQSFENAKFAINFDQARTGVDAQGNPIYDKQKQADMILGQQRDLYEQLKHATTSDEVTRISGEIQKNASQLYDLWGRTPEAARQVLAQLEDSERVARDTLGRLRQEAEDEANRYKAAATDALAILTGTADIANAVLAGMQHALESLDPALLNNLDQVTGALTTASANAVTDIDQLGGAARRAGGDLDTFGNDLLEWSGRFRGSSPTGNVQVIQAAASRSAETPIVILNGSVAAVATEVEIRIGDKVVRRSVNTMQRQMARSNF